MPVWILLSQAKSSGVRNAQVASAISVGGTDDEERSSVLQETGIAQKYIFMESWNSRGSSGLSRVVVMEAKVLAVPKFNWPGCPKLGVLVRLNTSARNSRRDFSVMRQDFASVRSPR